jgi:hypothetical protein
MRGGRKEHSVKQRPTPRKAGATESGAKVEAKTEAKAGSGAKRQARGFAREWAGLKVRRPHEQNLNWVHG